MKLTKKEAIEIIHCFFDLIDAHYGLSFHHIGDGDGISFDRAEKIKKIVKEKSTEYWENELFELVND